jgi:SAM-dependent methyltransferase
MDVFGRALLDFYTKGKADILWLHNSYGEPEEMPLDIFFRNHEEMPDLELEALAHCRGKILDVGAGVGSHALYLQQQLQDVTALDISVGAVTIMKKRGIKKVLAQDISTVETRFDTLLFLMNGIGLTGTVGGFESFLTKAKTLINPHGQLIFDSSNIEYLYEGIPKPAEHYYGEISYRYEYKNEKGNWFKWLYLDQDLLKQLAKAHGWDCEILFDDGEDQYLAQLTLISQVDN